MNFPDLKRTAIEMKNHHRPNYLLIEDKASGTQLIQELKGQGISVRDYLPPPGNDKQMRLYNQTVHFENGRVFLPKGASWLAEYVKELTGFPVRRTMTSRFHDAVSRPRWEPRRALGLQRRIDTQSRHADGVFTASRSHSLLLPMREGQR
jgi:predicted phage terminase large subunit-like protein